MSNSIFNPNKKYFDLLPIIGYVNTPDIFIRKFLTDCIKNYISNTGNVSCHLTYQTGHLNNKKLKKDFLVIFSSILKHIKYNQNKLDEFLDKFTVALDNASKTLSVVFEFNDLTTTITIASIPLESEKQPSIHNRKKIHESFYFPGVLSIFENNPYDIYTLKGKNTLLDAIAVSKSINNQEETKVISFYTKPPVLVNDLDIAPLLRSELFNTIVTLTGLSDREDQIQNMDSDYVSIYKDNSGFYIRIDK